MTTVFKGDDTLEKVLLKHKSISVSEIFGCTLQGEGRLIGKPTVFVRTGGCDYECPPCDTLYAVLKQYKGTWKAMGHDAVFQEVKRLSGDTPILVTLSGGNPAIQPLRPLITLGHEYGYTFALETQGSVPQSWFEDLDYLTLSPKGPSMIGTRTMSWEKLDRCISYAKGGLGTRKPEVSLKIVVFNDADFEYAQYAARRYPDIPMYLQAGNENPPHVAPFDTQAALDKLRWLSHKVTTEKWYTVTVLPQLHALMYGNQKGV